MVTPFFKKVWAQSGVNWEDCRTKMGFPQISHGVEFSHGQGVYSNESVFSVEIPRGVHSFPTDIGGTGFSDIPGGRREEVCEPTRIRGGKNTYFWVGWRSHQTITGGGRKTHVLKRQGLRA